VTSQTRKFIDLSDVLALKLDCKACKSSLTIPIARDLMAREEAFKLNDCPMCRTAWIAVNNSSYHAVLAEFTDKLKRLQGALDTAPWGFTLVLELKEEPKTSVSVPASGDRGA